MSTTGSELSGQDETEEHGLRWLEQKLLWRFGPLLGGVDLAKALGYQSMRGFQKAANRKILGLPVFQIEKRRGRYALVSDVAKWLIEQRKLGLEKKGRSTGSNAVTENGGPKKKSAR